MTIGLDTERANWARVSAEEMPPAHKRPLFIKSDPNWTDENLSGTVLIQIVVQVFATAKTFFFPPSFLFTNDFLRSDSSFVLTSCMWNV